MSPKIGLLLTISAKNDECDRYDHAVAEDHEGDLGCGHQRPVKVTGSAHCANQHPRRQTLESYQLSGVIPTWLVHAFVWCVPMLTLDPCFIKGRTLFAEFLLKKRQVLGCLRLVVAVVVRLGEHAVQNPEQKGAV